MWSVALIIGVAVAGAVVLLVTGVFLAVSIERRRRRYIMQRHGLSRGLSTYHRPKLSANETNYSHVTAPSTYLRRSIQLPYGVVSIGRLESGSVAEEEEAGDHTTQLLHGNHGLLHPKERRSIRSSFNGHPLHIPKTRRQKRLQKAMPLNQLQKSPLSAITEFTDSPPCKSPCVADTFSEAGKATAKPGPGMKEEKQLSAQWPLIVSKTRSSDATPTEIMSMTARASMLMRRGGNIVNISDPPRAMALTRSVSTSSTTSSAPGDPLPPLPVTDVYKRSRAHDLRPSKSNASIDTTGSSLLRATIGSPSNTTMELTTPGSENHLRIRGVDSRLNRKPSNPRLQVPPGKQTIHGLCASKPSIHSLHPTFDTNECSPEGARDYPALPSFVKRDDSFKTIDASKWENPLPLKINKTRSGGTNPARHSMYEASKVQQWRAASDPMTTNAFQTSMASGVDKIQRPASVATGNPLRWDRQGSFATNRNSTSSLDGARRGHKRQNCVRITNLPAIDPRPKSRTQMPELREEQPSTDADAEATDPPGSIEHSQPTSWLNQHDSTTSRTRSTVTAPVSASTSPFRNRPILTPSSRPLPPQYMRSPSSVSSGIPRPDSDIFTTPYIEAGSTSTTNYNSLPGQWPLSPNLRNNTRFNGSPLSGRPSESHLFESPRLPSPALDSSALYPRKSLVKGPRNARVSSSSPSPLQNKQGPNFRISKDRESNHFRVTKERDRDCSGWSPREKEREVDLRKSVMMLRSMNSEGRLLEPQPNIRFYRNVGVHDSSPDSGYRLTPPMNKRISGLRQSSCASSTMSLSISPLMDIDSDGNRNRSTCGERHGYASRGSSPLALPTLVNAATLNPTMFPNNRVKTGGPALTIPSQQFNSTANMSASPSGLSIWEDASVCGESPEPDRRIPQTDVEGDSSLHVTPLVLRTKSNHGDRDRDPKQHRDNQHQHQHLQDARRYQNCHARFQIHGHDVLPLSLSPSRPRTPNKAYPSPHLYSSAQRSGPGPGLYEPLKDDPNHHESRNGNGNGNESDIENNIASNSPSASEFKRISISETTSNTSPHTNSHLVQRLERAASSGQWQSTTIGMKSPRISTRSRSGSQSEKQKQKQRATMTTAAITTTERNRGMSSSSANADSNQCGTPRRNPTKKDGRSNIYCHDPFQQQRGEVGLGLRLGNSMLPVTAYY